MRRPVQGNDVEPFGSDDDEFDESDEAVSGSGRRGRRSSSEDLGEGSTSPPHLVSARAPADPPVMGLHGDDSGDGWRVGVVQDRSPDEAEDEEEEDDEAFPWADFNQLEAGLARVSWLVYPSHLYMCLKAAASIETSTGM